MSKYGENYKKMLDGYNKIVACIESTEFIEQLECVSNLADNWVNLMDHYGDEVYHDRSNRNRRKDANRLCDAGVKMFDELKEIYQQRLQQLTPQEYEGAFHPIRVKNIYEIVHEYNDE